MQPLSGPGVKAMNNNALLHAVIRISIIITSIEILEVPVLLSLSGNMGTLELVILNTVVLAIFAIPLISIYVIKPLIDDKTKTLANIRNMATTDPLTKLANRRLIMEHLDRVVAGCTRHHEYCAVLVINLDNFRLVNERYGYETGDAVLVEVARRLLATNRSSDIVGRIDGDEFVVLLERQESDIEITGNRIQNIADKFVAMINMPIKAKSKVVHVTASVGIRLLGFEPIDTDTAIREADSAMYRAKEEGGNRAIIFNNKSISREKTGQSELRNLQIH